MAIGPRSDGWQNYSHHIQSSIEDWDAGITLRETKYGDSQYRPHDLGIGQEAERQALELRCLEEGTTIRETANRRTAYLDTGVVIGACSGEETTYVFAECTSGFYHGRPICVRELKRLGAKL